MHALSLLAASLSTACTLFAQQNVMATKNFKSLPPGLVRQTGQGYRGEQPVGQPIVDTHCSAPISTKTAQAATKLQAAAAPSCSQKLITDTPNEAEWLQTCDPGVSQTVIRTTLTRLDDRTIISDIRMSKGGETTHTRSTVEYLGACPADMAPPAMPQLPTAPKASAEDCAQIMVLREQVKDATVESCRKSDLPPDYLLRCEASMRSIQERVQQLETLCKK